jgi:hypothetical protein
VEAEQRLVAFAQRGTRRGGVHRAAVGDVRPETEHAAFVRVRAGRQLAARRHHGRADAGEEAGDSELAAQPLIPGAHARDRARDARDDGRGTQVDEHVEAVAQDDRVACPNAVARRHRDRRFDGVSHAATFA